MICNGSLPETFGGGICGGDIIVRTDRGRDVAGCNRCHRCVHLEHLIGDVDGLTDQVRRLTAERDEAYKALDGRLGCGDDAPGKAEKIQRACEAYVAAEDALPGDEFDGDDYELSRSVRSLAEQRDDLVARLLTNDAGMAELVKRFDALRELIDHVRRELIVPESWPGGPPLAELIKGHLAELIEERSRHKSGEAEAWQEVVKVTAERDAALAKVKELENA